ncbi:Biorientation of chromosomes in cell division protein 1-like 1 [Lemmus lemmus]
MEGAPEETDTRDGKKQVERSEINMDEPQKQKSILKNEKYQKKDEPETHGKGLPKKETKSTKEKPEKEKAQPEEKLSSKHRYKGDGIHKAGDETELHSSEKGLKVEENTQKQSQQTKLSSDDKAERKSKHRNERKLSVLGRDGRPVSEYAIKTDEHARKDSKKERHLPSEKAKAEHKSRRSSDPKLQKDVVSAKQHSATLQKRSESCSEEKCETDSTNADSSLKPEEIHKERRKMKSLLEEKFVLKSKSKAQGKQIKVAETESQEGVTKQVTASKPDKEKNTEDNDPERQRKSKLEDRSLEEAVIDPAQENATPSAHGAQKDSGHKTKLPLVKEKQKTDKDSASSKPERKFSDGHRSRSLKHSNKDMKKREENKPDNKDGSTLVPQKESHDSSAVPVVDREMIPEGGTAGTSLANHYDSPNQSLMIKKSEVHKTNGSKEGSDGSTADIPSKANNGSKRHLSEDGQTTLLHSKESKANIPLAGRSTGMTGDNKNIGKQRNLMSIAKKESDLNVEPDVKQDSAAVENVVDLSTRKEAETVRRKHSRDPDESKKVPADVERKTENNEVDTSAMRDTASVSQQRHGKMEKVAAGSGRRDKAFIATSTEGKDKGIMLNPIKAGDATTTSSETGEKGMTLPCTSIEADEGFIMGACPRNHPLQVGAEVSECIVFAAAEEGRGVVTEGFAESETLLTSSKEGESRECTVAESEDRVADPLVAHTVQTETNVNSVATEEKDDAVTSAGSEEKCNGSSCTVEGTATFIGEVESDGAVTSAGTEIRAGSVSSEDVVGSQENRTRVGSKKETEGTVTCTEAKGRSDSFIFSLVTGVGTPEQRVVTGADVIQLNDDKPREASANQEDGSANDGTEGESAVTSTGITEEEGEGSANCTGSEDSSEGCAISSETEENAESAMDSTESKDIKNLPLVAAGPCDDEDIVTSTGAKEEDDEGEGVVTSTERGNETGHASTCRGIEESEGMLVCESAEGGARIGPTVEHVDAEAGVTTVNTNDSNVDSVSGVEKEIKDTDICSSAKGIVESSVTSAFAGNSDGPPVLGGSESPAASATSHHSDSQLTRKETVEDMIISTGLVRGSDDVLVSGAVPECEVGHISARGKDEGVITSVENEDCDGLMASTASSDVSNKDSLAGSKSQSNGLMISTSTNDCTLQISAMIDVRRGHLCPLSTEENMEDTRLHLEGFEAPMPSAISGDENQLTSAT